VAAGASGAKKSQREPPFSPLQSLYPQFHVQENPYPRENMTSKIPNGWHVPSHKLWLSGKQHESIQKTIGQLNRYGVIKPLPLVCQLAYYLFLIHDYQGAATVLSNQLNNNPSNLEVLLNLAACYSRMQKYNEAVHYANSALKLQPSNTLALDVLASNHSKLGNFSEAAAAGTRVLMLRDQQSTPLPKGWSLPQQKPSKYAKSPAKQDVIAFSLWGKDPRYLRGAIHNTLLARQYFPEWQLRFYVDEDMPLEVTTFLTSHNADIITSSKDSTTRQKLCWRFQVANDPKVGYFLVRDADSIFSVRERMAVEAWLASDYWFHVMRDWWTHTDLILAGMWGGVAGVLPPLSNMVAEYDSGRVETPNIDQWFLRDRVWPYVRISCLVHDRCFRTPGALPMPAPTPKGNAHIGQDEFAVRRVEQEQFIKPHLKQHSALARVLALE